MRERRRRRAVDSGEHCSCLQRSRIYCTRYGLSLDARGSHIESEQSIIFLGMYISWYIGESGANNVQITESSRRLSYIPQCNGSEEILRDCSAVDQDDSCDAPLVISCWNSSSVTSIILLSSTAVYTFSETLRG